MPADYVEAKQKLIGLKVEAATLAACFDGLTNRVRAQKAASRDDTEVTTPAARLDPRLHAWEQQWEWREMQDIAIAFKTLERVARLEKANRYEAARDAMQRYLQLMESTFELRKTLYLQQLSWKWREETRERLRGQGLPVPPPRRGDLQEHIRHMKQWWEDNKQRLSEMGPEKALNLAALLPLPLPASPNLQEMRKVEKAVVDTAQRFMRQSHRKGRRADLAHEFDGAGEKEIIERLRNEVWALIWELWMGEEALKYDEGGYAKLRSRLSDKYRDRWEREKHRRKLEATFDVAVEMVSRESDRTRRGNLDQEVANRELREEVNAVVTAPRVNEALWLRVKEYKYQEIADLMGLKVDTVRDYLKAARRQLREAGVEMEWLTPVTDPGLGAAESLPGDIS